MSYVRTVVDGVPVLWAKCAGPLRAGLVFRVGRADETLARGGVTHLVEHLALHQVGQTDYHVNGTTGMTTTSFHTQGTADQVTSFLTGVTAALRRLPLDRVPIELDILHTEASGKSSDPREQLLLWRHGPATYGLPAFAEFGLYDLAALDVSGWTRTWFTCGNAALWIAGDAVPDGLRLDLPDGERQPVPAPTEVLPQLPAYFTGSVNGMALDAHVPRTTAAALLSGVLERRLHAELRVERGLSYTASATYESLNGRLAAITAFADALPERSIELVGPFVDVLLGLAETGVPEADVEPVRSMLEASLGESGIAAQLVSGAARDLLAGAEIRTAEELRAEVAAVTPDDLQVVAKQVLASALAMVPRGSSIRRGGFVPAPAYSSDRVAGKEYRGPAVDRRHKRQTLVVGADGISLVDGTNVLTVRYAECPGMLEFADGGRMLFAPDGAGISIEPRQWRLPASVVSGVDTAMPRAKIARVPSRPEESIPRAVPTRAERMRLSLPRTPAHWVLLGLLVTLVIAGIVLLVTGYGGDIVRFCVLVLLIGGLFAAVRGGMRT